MPNAVKFDHLYRFYTLLESERLRHVAEAQRKRDTSFLVAGLLALAGWAYLLWKILAEVL